MFDIEGSGLKVDVCEGGYLLTWRIRREAALVGSVQSFPSAALTVPTPSKGHEIFTSEKALLKRVKELLARMG